MTFDSGGLNLKRKMEMVTDGMMGMSGAAVIVGVMRGLAALKVPINVTGKKLAVTSIFCTDFHFFLSYCNDDSEERLSCTQ